ncbi:unnamed protein product [Phyllotreta striolata]|uniref:Mitochondrial carrier protein n=1 Tax=Phyllotreta striolata TaxID=444603 RepID=A0A9N9TTX6_PHYSR|nr:unnamed protein product [Phyllotreta striolata]
MVGYTKKYENFTTLDYALAGGGSGFVTRALCQPLDVLKIRLQLQVEPVSHRYPAKYQSLYQTLRVILHEEGIKALWKGHVPAQWLSIVYGMAQFSTYEYLDRRLVLLNASTKYTYMFNFLSGTIAGCTATVVSFPFDVARTRLVGQSERKMIYKGTVHSWRRMVKSESYSTLFRGLLPTFIQVGPHAGIQFVSYKLFNDIQRLMFKYKDTSMSASMVSGSLAGLVAKTAIYPFDLLKKRMQVQGFDEGRRLFGKLFHCNGLLDAFRKVYIGEGVAGFFKGYLPSMVKAVVTGGLYFSTYEMCCKFICYYK